MNFLQNSANLLRTEHRGCATAKENCLQLLLSKNSLLLQMLQLCQKCLHIFLDLLRLEGITIKAAIGAAQIAEGNMQI